MIQLIKKQRDAGFTLIELLVVVLIIGVLSGIVVLAVSNSTANAKVAACKSDASTLLTALDNYAADKSPSTFPTGRANDAVETIDGNSWSTYDPTSLAVLVPKYIKVLPDTVKAYYRTDSATATTTVAVGTVSGADCGTKVYYVGGIKNA